MDLDDLEAHSSEANDNFRYAFRDVERLIELYDQISGGKLSTAARQMSVLKRAAVILSVTTWETYIEDIIRERFELRLERKSSPVEFQSALNAAAQDWLDGRPTPPDIMKWVGEAWKGTIRDRFALDVARLNTPNTENIRRLTKLYLGEDLTQHWKWRGVSNEAAKERLDELIALRGQLVHRARDVYDWKGLVRKETALRAVTLIRGLVDATNKHFGIRVIWIHPRVIG